MAMVPPDPYAARGRGPRIIPVGALPNQAGGIPGGGMTLDALIARQKQLASDKQTLPEMQNPIQGLAYAVQQGMHGFQQGRAERDLSEGRAALAHAMTQFNPDTGEFTPEAIATMGALDPEHAFAALHDLAASRQRKAELEQGHRWDVETETQRETAASDLAAQSQRAQAEQNDLNRKADDARQRAQDLAAAGRDEEAHRARLEEQDARAKLDQLKADEDAKRDVAKVGQSTAARQAEAERLGLKQGTDEYNNYVLTGGSAAHVKTEAEKLDEQTTARQAQAEKLGLKPGSQEYKDYTLTGQINKMPASELQTITETDDKVHATDQFITEMQSVITPDASGQSVNDLAYSGIGADTRTSLARNDPTGLLADKRRGEATTKLKNIIGSEAISSLRAIFGSNPTEGERQVLMDMNASVDKSPQERKDIIERAVRLAKDRLAQLQQRSQQLRTGTYTQSGDGTSGSSSSQPVQPKPGDVRNGYRFKGGDPADQNSWEKVQ